MNAWSSRWVSCVRFSALHVPVHATDQHACYLFTVQVLLGVKRGSGILTKSGDGNGGEADGWGLQLAGGGGDCREDDECGCHFGS